MQNPPKFQEQDGFGDFTARQFWRIYIM